MKADDLMIGDWIGWLPTWKNEETGEIEWDGDRNNPIIGKVGMLMKDCTTIDYCNESIEVEDIGLIPIPLTPEILEKNGFESTSAPSERVWKRNGQEVWLDNEGKNYWANIKNGEFYFEGYIEHAHELQNCLKLVGIDKDIEL